MILHAGHGMAYGIACQDMAWYMISPGGHCMDIWYGLDSDGMVYCRPGGHGMVNDKVWRGVRK